MRKIIIIIVLFFSSLSLLSQNISIKEMINAVKDYQNTLSFQNTKTLFSKYGFVIERSTETSLVGKHKNGNEMSLADFRGTGLKSLTFIYIFYDIEDYNDFKEQLIEMKNVILKYVELGGGVEKYTYLCTDFPVRINFGTTKTSSTSAYASIRISTLQKK